MRSIIGKTWRVSNRATGLLCSIATRHATAVSLASAGRITLRCGMARQAAKCSIGSCVGPSSPRKMLSCVKTKIGVNLHQGRQAQRAADNRRRRRTWRHKGSIRSSAMPFRMAPMPCSRTPKWKLRPP